MPSELEVRCTVSNCYFWESANFCGANQILITADQASNEFAENLGAGPNLSQMAETPVAASRVTCCHTFRER